MTTGRLTQDIPGQPGSKGELTTIFADIPSALPLVEASYEIKVFSISGDLFVVPQSWVVLED